jgi:ABC-type glycerol-3-phosphate transport system substrate-binding protein
MTLRSWILTIILGGPAACLLLFGPRGQYDVPAGRMVVRYWEKWTGVEGLAMQHIVDEFNRTVGAEQNIWVDYNAVSNVERRTLIATAGGDPPDLAGLNDFIVPQFADRNALMPLAELVDEFDIDLEAFKPIWLKIGRYDGTLYALPSTPFTIALYYNRRLFREARLDPDHPPRTIAELDECARRLTKRGPDGKLTQIGFTTSPAMLGWWHWAWPKFFDAELWDGRNFQLDSPAVHQAAEWIKQRREAIGNADLLAFEAGAGSTEGTQNPFLSEQLAMVFQGPWMSNWINAYTPDLDYGVAPFPSVTAARQNVFASTDVFVIPRGARRPREAMVFLDYVLRQDVMEGLCSAHCKVSPFKRPGADFFSGHPNRHIRVFDEMASSRAAFGFPQMPMFSEVTTELLFMLENILRGAREPGEAISETQERVHRIVTEYQEMAAKRRE